MQKITHGSLFSGIGGFDLAAEWMGWENVFHCEWNDFGKKVLKYYWPKSISYDDITKTDFTIHRNTIDVLSGGFPCQPYSAAGKRLGKEDERHLWPEMLRAIREIQPSYVVGENVRGLTNWNGGMVFDEVQADLEAEGYEVLPFLLPACAVNAPHRRDRIWFVACSENFRCLIRQTSDGRQKQKFENGNDLRHISVSDGERGNAANADGERCHDGCDNWQERHIQADEGIAEKDKPKRERRQCGLGEIGAVNANAYNEGLERSEINGSTSRSRKERNEQSAGLFCTDWSNFPTQSPICDGNDGLSTRLDGITFPKWRNESIKAGGNAIVPQVAYEIFKVIDLHLNENQYYGKTIFEQGTV